MSNERRRVLGENTFSYKDKGLFVMPYLTGGSTNQLLVSEDGINWSIGCKLSNSSIKLTTYSMMYIRSLNKLGGISGYADYDERSEIDMHGYGSFTISAALTDKSILKDTSKYLSLTSMPSYSSYLGNNSSWTGKIAPGNDGGIYHLNSSISIWASNVTGFEGASECSVRSDVTSSDYTGNLHLYSGISGGTYHYISGKYHIIAGVYNGNLIGIHNKSSSYKYCQALSLTTSTDSNNNTKMAFLGADVNSYLLIGIYNGRLLSCSGDSLYLSNSLISNYITESPGSYPETVDGIKFTLIHENENYWNNYTGKARCYLPISGTEEYILSYESGSDSSLSYSLYKINVSGKSLTLVKSNIFTGLNVKVCSNSTSLTDQYGWSHFTYVNGCIYSPNKKVYDFDTDTTYDMSSLLINGSEVSGHVNRISPAFIPY